MNGFKQKPCYYGCGNVGARYIVVGSPLERLWLCYPCGDAKLQSHGANLEALKEK